MRNPHKRTSGPCRGIPVPQWRLNREFLAVKLPKFAQLRVGINRKLALAATEKWPVGIAASLISFFHLALLFCKLV